MAKKDAGYASPPCFMHELEESGPAGVQHADPRAWDDVRRWRRSERERLIAARLALPQADREASSAKAAVELDTAIGDPAGKIISVYWPFRGEHDLRPWLARAIERGATGALPVVVEKSAPLELRAYRLGDTLERGIWNIPVPVRRDVVIPDIVIAPLVGYDAAGFRLGYGGGYYDRTLAALPRKPLVIGLGYALGRLATIYPQPHDIAMDLVVVA
ncbi:MAG: 5-formyltetrahydrofolate cyclo-ligase [Brucellaceae bacterium]|nr:5-formyltetrahydrofolate cyclo-ligase [Brucellaceae bacterium]